MTAVGLACGPVTWEAPLLRALQEQTNLHLHRRYVDMAEVRADIRTGSRPDVLVAGPSVRGFAPGLVEEIRAAGVAVVVLVDDVRPPWLADAHLDVREAGAWAPAALLADLDVLDVPPVAAVRERDVTVFVGVAGGVGTSSLCWLAARQRHPGLVVDGAAQPVLAFAAGLDVETVDAGVAGVGRVIGTADGEREMRLLAPAFPVAEGFSAAAVADTVEEAVTAGQSLLLDAGTRLDLLPLLGPVRRTVLVSTAAPQHMARLPGLLAVLDDAAPALVVVNRLRATVAGSARARSAVRSLVQESCGVDPVLVGEDQPGFDRAWLRGDWGHLAGVGAALADSVSPQRAG